MEYSRKVTPAEGAAPTGAGDRIMDFGSVFIPSPAKGDTQEVAASAISGSQPAGVNIAELLLSRSFGYVVRHRDFEERSNHYDALLAAESRALSGKKGIHSAKESPVMHITDLTVAAAKKAKDFLPSLQRIRRIPAVLQYVLSGHRCKLYIPKLTCSIAFAFSGVRCPGRGEPFSDEAISVMRRRIMQRDVEVRRPNLHLSFLLAYIVFFLSIFYSSSKSFPPSYIFYTVSSCSICFFKVYILFTLKVFPPSNIFLIY